MPVSAQPSSYLSDTIEALKRQVNELQRAVGRPVDQIRDSGDNVLHMAGGAEYPVLSARGQGTSLVLANGAVAVADENGRDTRPLAAQQFNGPVVGDSTGTHHGDVGTPTEAHNHYGDLHGNSYGFHFGPVGDGSTQNQINALNVFSTGHFGTQHGDVGTPAEFWQLYGTIHAPSERAWKRDLVPFDDAGRLLDATPAYRWRWARDRALVEGLDDDEHVGPMVDDVAALAPWLVRQPEGAPGRSLTDRDLVGVLWAALQQTRRRVDALEARAAANRTG